MKSLIFALAIQISGLPAALWFLLGSGSAWAEDAPKTQKVVATPEDQLDPELLSVRTTGTDINNRGQTYYLRARFAGLPIVRNKGGIPVRQEMEDFENAVEGYIESFEKALNRIDATLTTNPHAQVVINQASVLFYLYRDILFKLVETKLALPNQLQYTQPFLITDYIKRFSISVPWRIAIQLPLLESDFSTTRFGKTYDAWGDQFKTLAFDWKNGRPDRGVKVGLSSGFVQGLDAQTILNKNPSQASYLTFIQFLSVRQLLKSLDTTRRLQKDGRRGPLEIPENLARKMQTFNMSELALSDAAGIDYEPKFKESLVDTLKLEFKNLPTFSSDDYAKSVALAMDPEASAEEKSTPEQPALWEVTANMVKNDLGRVEKAEWENSFRKNLEIGNWNFSSMNDEMAFAALRTILARTFGDIHRADQIKQQAKLGVPVAPPIGAPEDQIKAFSDGLDHRRKQNQVYVDLIAKREIEFGKEIEDRVLFGILNRARTDAKNNSEGVRRGLFYRELLQAAIRLRDGSGGQGVNMDILIKTLNPEIQKLELSSDIRQAEKAPKTALKDIQDAPSYKVAYNIYHSVLKRLEGENNGDHGSLLNSANDRFARKGIQGSIDRDLKAWRSLGDLLKMNVNLSETETKVVPNSLLSNSELKTYEETLQGEALRSERLLSMKMKDARFGEKKLFELLLDYQHAGLNSEDLIDRGLHSLEEIILQNIASIGDKDNIDELEIVLKSTLMDQLLMVRFPEFEVQRVAFLRHMEMMTPFERLMYNHVKPTLHTVGYGMMALWAVQIYRSAGLRLARLAVPKHVAFLGNVVGAMGSFIQGFFWPVLIGAAGNLAYDVSEHLEAREDLSEAEELFMSDPRGNSLFISYSDLQSYRAQKKQTLVATSINGAFLFLTAVAIGHTYLTKLPRIKAVAGKLGRNLDSFKTLRMERVNFAKEEILLARDIELELAGTDLVKKQAINDAYDDLISTIDRGEAWRPDVIANRKGGDMTAWEKKILKEFQRQADTANFQDYSSWEASLKQ